MKRLWLIFMIFSIFSLTGCCEKEAIQRQKNSYKVIDEAGRKIVLNGKPQRIASLTYGTDEILTDLVGTERIIAYSRWAGDPEISFITDKQVREVGCKLQENTEAIFSLKPDLVVATTATTKEVISSLEALGIKVYLAGRPKNYQQMKQKVLMLSVAVGERNTGEKIVKKMDNRIVMLENKLKKIPKDKRKVAIAFNFTSAMGRKGDLIDNIMNMAHITNGIAKLPNGHIIRYISKEQIVHINPDIFLLPTWNYDNKQNISEYAQQIKSDPAYKDVKAIKNNQIKFVSDRYRYVSSHHIVDAIEKFAMAVYPELFENDEI